MSTIVRPLATDRQPGSGRGGDVFDLPPGTGGNDGPGAFPNAQRRYYTGMMVGLAGILMLFTGFTSAFLVRRGLGDDWQSIPLPALVWVNALVLLLSSGCLEMARKRVHDIVALRKWWLAATGLGVAFLIGQGVVWKQLWNAGLFLGTNPSSSFFYVLTADSWNPSAGRRHRAAGPDREALEGPVESNARRRDGPVLAFHGWAVGVPASLVCNWEVT